jgi:hypothetical protein
VMNVGYTQVDGDLPGYLTHNNKDLLNHNTKFP